MRCEEKLERAARVLEGAKGAVMLGLILDRWVQLMGKVARGATILGRCESICQVQKVWKSLVFLKFQHIYQCGWSTEGGREEIGGVKSWSPENKVSNITKEQ